MEPMTSTKAVTPPVAMAPFTPLAAIRVGDNPEGIQASEDGTHLYVANWMDDTMSVIDAGTRHVTRSFPVGDSPRAFGTFLRP